MTTPEPLSAATQMLRDAVADAGDVDALPPHRAAAVERIAEALRARGQARRRKRTITTLAFAAGVALVVGGGAFAVHRAHRDAGGRHRCARRAGPAATSGAWSTRPAASPPFARDTASPSASARVSPKGSSSAPRPPRPASTSTPERT